MKKHLLTSIFILTTSLILILVFQNCAPTSFKKIDARDIASLQNSSADGDTIITRETISETGQVSAPTASQTPALTQAPITSQAPASTQAPQTPVYTAPVQAAVPTCHISAFPSYSYSCASGSSYRHEVGSTGCSCYNGSCSQSYYTPQVTTCADGSEVTSTSQDGGTCT